MIKFPHFLHIMLKFSLALIFYTATAGFAQDLVLQKAGVYNGHEEIDQWFMSEKLDGIRGYWNGKTLLPLPQSGDRP